jgi:hypothetical protein
MPDARNGSSAPLVNPWIIAVAVTIATFMEVLDTSIDLRRPAQRGGSLGTTLLGTHV